MTKENETLMVLQNESFNYSRYTDSYLMESWAYDSDLSKPKEDFTALSFLYEQCKTPKDQRMTACSRGSNLYKPERAPGASSPDLISLESPTHIMKLLTNNISSSQMQPQEVLDLNRKLSPLCPPKQSSPPPQTYIQPTVTESYDKQVINTIFDSLLQTAYPGTTEAPVSYSDPFVGQSSPVYSESYTNSPSERIRSDFQFMLGAPQASQNKTTEMPMVYLNKGQFYPISLLGMDSSTGHAPARVKTVIMAVFENDKSPEMQLKCWNHWHARQPTVKQRVIDIADYKETLNGISNVEEVAFNALSFIWNTNEEAKVYIGINSLSTDFSAQKGVKGLPLNLQIDTYDISTGTNMLIHRAACQIKVFCDKGAERKMRDEERKRSKRRTKNDSSNAKQSQVSSSVGAESTCFKALEDHVTQPVLFIPEMHYSNIQRCGLNSSVMVEDGDSRGSLKRVSCYSEGGERCSPPPSKQARREEAQRVLLYVRREEEEVFDALMLNSPTLKGLREAISEKYGMQEETIGKIFKKCKRGIFVNMDDNIIEHYSNHSAFLITIAEVMMGHFHITLTEL